MQARLCGSTELDILSVFAYALALITGWTESAFRAKGMEASARRMLSLSVIAGCPGLLAITWHSNSAAARATVAVTAAVDLRPR